MDNKAIRALAVKLDQARTAVSRAQRDLAEAIVDAEQAGQAAAFMQTGTTSLDYRLVEAARKRRTKVA
jgi:hypothetical protein